MKILVFSLLISFPLFSSCMMNDSMSGMNHSQEVPKIIEGPFNNQLVVPITQPIESGLLKAQYVGGSFQGLGYAKGSILGPTLIGRQGANLSVNLTNQLSEGTNLHWHGLEVPVDQDGLPENGVQPGESRQYSFPISNRAGMYWYHPHVMGTTAKQAYQGLAGLIILRDAEEFELPLVIQDKKNTSTYNPTQVEVMDGFLGSEIYVNGILSPYKSVKRGTYRLRLLNGSNARVYNFAFDDRRIFNVIGSDGGLLPSGQKVKQLLLGPGERADLLVSFSQDKSGNTPYLVSQSFTGGGAQGKQDFKILKFLILDSTGLDYTLPAGLSLFNKFTGPSASRNFLLDMTMKMNSGKMGIHTINGQSYNSARIDIHVKAKSLESWTFKNNTNEIHPVHIHGVQFYMANRVGSRTIQPMETGWKDSFVLLQGESATVEIRFGTELGRHLFHCHNLEHEEDGMMLQYLLEP
jgi:blue copper oxidase